MTGAILAGGRSRRMEGRDKTRLRVEGQSVLVRQAALLRELCGDCVLLAREEQLAELEALGAGEVLADLFDGCGPLGGLYTALEETEDDVFLLACDLPFAERDLLARVLEAWRTAAPRPYALLPRGHDAAGQPQVEPFCSVWSRDCRRLAYIALENRDFGVRAFAEHVKARYLDLNPAEHAQLRNINAPTDLQDGLELL